MAKQDVLEELLSGCSAGSLTTTDRERVLTAAVGVYIEAKSHRVFIETMGRIMPEMFGEEEVKAANQRHAIGMARVIQIAGALDTIFPNEDGLPYGDIIESISLGDTDPRTGVPFDPVE